MARYGRGENDGYDTILHRISRYDTIQYDIWSQNALPYVTVNSPRLMQRSQFSLYMDVTAHWLDDNFGTYNKCLTVTSGAGQPHRRLHLT